MEEIAVFDWEWSTDMPERPSLPFAGAIEGRRIRLRRAILARDGWSCRYCRRRVFQHRELPGRLYLDLGLTYDHVIPRCRHGESTLANMVACCAACNNTKADQEPVGRWALPPAPASPLPYVSWVDCWSTAQPLVPHPRELVLAAG